jgi:hypothetical protein
VIGSPDHRGHGAYVAPHLTSRQRAPSERVEKFLPQNPHAAYWPNGLHRNLIRGRAIGRMPVRRPPAGLHRGRLVRALCTDMTAEPNPRSLSLVAQTADYAEAEAVLRQWDTEAHLVGAVMHLSNPLAVAILESATRVISGTHVPPRPEQTKRGQATGSAQTQ